MNVVNVEQEEMLMKAISEQLTDLVVCFLDNYEIKKNTFQNLFIEAINYHNIVLITYLKNKNFALTFENNLALSLASSYGQNDIIQLLIDNKVKPESYSNKAIKEAFSTGNYDTVHYLFSFKNVKKSLENDDLNIFQFCMKEKISSTVKSF